MSEKVAVITGAGSGIGQAVALALQGAGFHVILTGRRQTALDETAQRAKAGGGNVVVMPADVCDESSVQHLFQSIESGFGRLDVLFNNAGIFSPAREIDELPVEEWRRAVDTNLTGAFLCAREAFRIMKRQSPRGGRIINNGSISAQSPRPMSAPYTATKHALTGLTKSIGLDGRPYDIACSQIDIGNAATDLTERMAAGILQANGTMLVEPRIDVAHVADAVVYIAKLPLDANVPFMTLMATKMPLVGRG